MRRKFQWILVAACGVLLGAAVCQAETNLPPGIAAPEHPASGQHHHLSPIEYFRGLLAMTPEERDHELANRSSAERVVILAKVKEYEAMPHAVREARLCQTELHWALSRLMRLGPSERASQLAEVSPLYYPLVTSLLREWDALPAEKQKSLLEREDFIGLYLRVQSSPAAQHEILDKLPPQRRAMWELEMARWQALPEGQRAELCGQFQRFCVMSGTEQQETVSALSEAERKEMEQALRMFSLLPPEQRTLCINSFRKFATMAPAERNEFLRNAARWDAMTSRERELWREMVQTLPPMPPMPPGFQANVMPPMPPGFAVQTMPPMPPLPPNVTTPVIVARAPAPPSK